MEKKTANWPKIITPGSKTTPCQKQPPLLERTIFHLCKFRAHWRASPVPKTRDHLKNQSMKCSLLGETPWVGKQVVDLEQSTRQEIWKQGKPWLKGTCAQEGNPLIENNPCAINLKLWLLIWNGDTVTQPHWETSFTVMRLMWHKGGEEKAGRSWYIPCLGRILPNGPCLMISKM